MANAIEIDQTGGPQQLQWRVFEPPEPQGDEVLVRQMAVGLNFLDVYYRTGFYPPPSFPFVPGNEAAGVVEALGPEVSGLMVGDRVMYARGPVGAYTTHRTMAPENLLKVPDGIGYEHAASSLLRGLTAHYLLRRVIAVREGMTVLVQAAAGGVGLLLCQWAKHLGATVIACAGSEEKAALARSHGAAHTILYREEDVAGKVRALTGGQGCNVVYDSVGKDTFDASLASLMRFGLMVSYGQSSGPVPPLDLQRLSRGGSLFLTRPTLTDYTADVMEYRRGAAEFFELVLAGTIRLTVGQSYYLSDAATAQADLEAGRTHGSSVLIVDQ